MKPFEPHIGHCSWKSNHVIRLIGREQCGGAAVLETGLVKVLRQRAGLVKGVRPKKIVNNSAQILFLFVTTSETSDASFVGRLGSAVVRHTIYYIYPCDNQIPKNHICFSQSSLWFSQPAVPPRQVSKNCESSFLAVVQVCTMR